LAITCRTDDERRALAKAIGLDAVEQNRLAVADLPSADTEDLHRRITRWTRAHDPYTAMYELQGVGVPAGVCQDAQDRCDNDPQLSHLGWLTEVTGTKIGRWPVADVPVKLSRTPGHIGGLLDRGAPCYGEDNEWVLGELLGYGRNEITELQAEGVI
jgi:crotonobetainyl-CoA:carnitine CoA-transferase CaiB-like acyl-CoA transferase